MLQEHHVVAPILIIFVITVFNSSTHNFTSQVGIGSNLQVAFDEFIIISRISSSVN